VTEYAAKTLEIMVPADNPKHIASLNDLGRADLKLSMPNLSWEGVANQNCICTVQGGAIYRQFGFKSIEDRAK
jgi:ABC-type sulfate transport system substrate-binding protein